MHLNVDLLSVGWLIGKGAVGRLLERERGDGVDPGVVRWAHLWKTFGDRRKRGHQIGPTLSKTFGDRRHGEGQGNSPLTGPPAADQWPIFLIKTFPICQNFFLGSNLIQCWGDNPESEDDHLNLQHSQIKHQNIVHNVLFNLQIMTTLPIWRGISNIWPRILFSIWINWSE